MKVSSLLAQYLYTHQQLSLPGLGRFNLLQTEPPVTDSGKSAKNAGTGTIEFTADTQIKESPELVSFIAAQTGKIKALATSDLESHLELAHQFLNIGKPFTFEGIGTLEKKQSGEMVFTMGPAAPAAARETPLRDTSSDNTSEEIPDYKSVFYQQKKTKSNWKKPLAIVLLLAGVVLAIWGGYTVYKRTTARNRKTTTETEAKPAETVLVTDTTRALAPDTTRQQTVSPPVAGSAPPVVPPAGTYKFIIETAVKERALARFARLKAFGLDIKMETPDSARFKLFFLLPAAAGDTSRMVDSLRKIYTPAGNRAYVEN